MTTGCSTPVNSTVVIALHVVLDLFELSMVPHATYSLDTRIFQILMDGQELIAMKHEERRIYLDILRFTTRITSLQQSKGRSCKHTDVPKAIHTTTGRSQTVSQFLFSLLRTTRQTETNVTTLKHMRYLVNYLQRDSERIVALHPYSHHIIVTITETITALATSTNGLMQP